MQKISLERIAAVIFFLFLVAGAMMCLQRVVQDIETNKYFEQPEDLHNEIIFLSAYVLIILFVLRYGYFLAIDRVSWPIIKDDFLYLLNKKYFTKVQWWVNVLLFWLALIGFVYSLVISAMKGQL